MRLLQPRRDLPIDRTNVVAGAIVPDLLEIQPASAHAGGESAGQQAVHGLLRQEGYPAAALFQRNQLFEIDIDAGYSGFPVDHGGPQAAATSSVILSITWSAESPCDTAS